MGSREGATDLRLDDGQCRKILGRYVPEEQFWARRIGEQKMKSVGRKVDCEGEEKWSN